MKFSNPDNMPVVYNDNTRFEATNTVITLDIHPCKGENLTYSGMKNAIVHWLSRSNWFIMITTAATSLNRFI